MPAAALVIAAAVFALRDAGQQAAALPPLAAASGALPKRLVSDAPKKPEPAPQKTAEEQLAEAEREAAEREHALAEAQRAEVKRRMQEAEAKRKLAEQASDKERHERIARELASAGAANARRAVKITMYSTAWCRACKQARSYMQQHDIAFTDYDVERDAQARSQTDALNPRGSVPTISIDGDVLVGFSPSSLESRIDRAAKRRNGG
ncbi:MAG TPA: glutaredoxin domain-containing protein [Polyangiales bacterium]|nr:glutaredoxin domain-containing protein [Polyangiales bacterium]